jgi:hypothetical protein
MIVNDGVPYGPDCVDQGVLECVIDKEMLVEVERVYQVHLLYLVLHARKVLDAVAVLNFVILGRDGIVP